MKKLIFFLISLVLSTIIIAPLFGFNPLVFAFVLGAAGLINGSHKNSYFATGLMQSNMNADFVFKTAKNLVSKYLNLPPGQTVDDQMITQATLRSEVLLNTSSTNFHVPVNQNDSITGSSQYNTENRLGLQDLFVVSSIAVLVAKPASGTDGAFRAYTYPSAQVFSGAGTAAALYGAFSNGYIRYENNGQLVLPYWDLLRHLKVPNQQYFDKPYYSAANTQSYNDEQNGEVDGFEVVQPGFVLSGASKVNMNIVLPTALAAVEANSRIIVLQRGLILQNLSGVR